MEATKEAGAAQSSSSGSGSNSNTDGSYDCNICLEIAHDPVVTLCGHLFCWPCLYRWLVSRSAAKECPVCKSAVEEAKVVPIYGRGKGSTDPRTKEVEIPNRPSGRRTDVPRSNLQQMGFSFFTGAPSAATAQFGNVTLSAGFGLFPFLFGFCTTGGFPDLNIGGAGTGNAGNGGNATQERHENTQDALLSRLLLFVGFFVVVCLLFF